jgi:metallo-beta-lactamase class B
MKRLPAILALFGLALNGGPAGAQGISAAGSSVSAAAATQSSASSAGARSIYGNVPCSTGSGPGPLCDTQPGMSERFKAQAEANKPGSGMPASWTQPIAPYHIVGNIYYVGTAGLAAYLFTSPNGLVLIDGTLRETADQVERNIAALGHRLGDVKILLNSHAHYDHAGGLRQLKEDTGAKLMASAGDRGALESGAPPSDTSYGLKPMPPVKVDRTLVDGEPVRLGSILLIPLITPGHTPGCTSWATTAFENGTPLRVMIPCSLTVAGNKLVGNKGYPGIVADFRRTFARFRKLDADIVLPVHPELTDVLGRARRAASGTPDAFIMPGALARMVADAEKAFDAELTRQEDAAHQRAR